MNITLNIKLDEASLTAIGNLIRPLTGVLAAEDTAVVEPAQSEKTTSADQGPFLWANHQTGEFGKVNSKAAYDKLKAKDSDVVRVTEAQYKKLVADAKKDAEEEKEEKAPAKAKKETKKATKKKAADTDVPDKAELIEVFSEFLPKDLDKKTRIERREFVSGILQRCGASKVSELKDDYWAMAIELVQRKLAGEDVDPNRADFDLIEEEDEDDDLV